MLENRDYMREPEYSDSGWRPAVPTHRSWTVTLLVIYAVVFLAELAGQRFFPNNHLFHGSTVFTAAGEGYMPGYLPLSAEGLTHGYIWQLVTYQFMHAGWLHLFLNAWVIFMFGRELESLLGGKKFLALMFSSGIVGGVFQVLVALVWPQYFGGPVVGASACAFGLIAAYAMMFPHRELQLLLLFVFPVTLRAKTLLIGSVVLAVAGIAFPMDNVANAAHLGGMVMGWFFVRKILQGDWSRLTGALRPAEKKSPAHRPLGRAAEVKPEAGVDESEVDAILDKISAQGIQSLTKRERETLEAARKQMGKR
jgi:membrane associated rhomboid family serine protease